MAEHRSTPLDRRPTLGIRAADGALALLVVAIVALMVVPLPTWLLDVLLAGNLALSVAILLVTLYVGSALEITAFPTLLLITTLVRVALNVSSTRLILLHADAGAVIHAFGAFVVSGNFAVGSVIFLILTIIQFVVVAKGSERVAEVGARFTLDALPGKQMAIDAELRTGTIDGQEARLRRRNLERESQFYGAMDGAVKFVKGDVVATLLIAIVNIVGGVAIGVTEHGLDFGSALRRYGLLTIGDGLVTQIPALLLATSAGILVTRVASDEPDTALGSELSAQLLGVPRALAVAGVLVFGLALVPGLPGAPFLVIGVALFALSRRPSRQRSWAGAATTRDAPSSAEPLVPWSVTVNPKLALRLGKREAGIQDVTDQLRRRMSRERGVTLPPCRITVDAEFPSSRFALSIHEVPAASIVLPEGTPSAELATIIEASALPILLERASDFLGITETKLLLDDLERHSPATVRHVVPKIIDVAQLSEVLRRLVEEDFSVRDLRAILEALARARTEERDPSLLVEHVRTELRRPLTHALTGGAAELGVVLLDPGIEEAIRAAVSKTSSGTFLSLAPAAARDLVAATRRALDASVVPGETHPAVVLTPPDIRRFVRNLLATDFPRVRVIAFPELLPEIELKIRARVSLTGI